MLITIEKIHNGKVAVKVAQVVTTLEDLIKFANKFGYSQRYEEFVFDFQGFQPITYRVNLVEVESVWH